MRVTAALDSASDGTQNEFTDIRDEAVTFSRDLTRRETPGKFAKCVSRVKVTDDFTTQPVFVMRHYLQRTRSRTNAGIDIRREYSVQRDDKWVLLAAALQHRERASWYG